MRTARLLAGLVTGLGLGTTAATAQSIESIRSSVLFETYTFDPDLSVRRMSQLTVPFGVAFGLGRFGNLAVSSGYTVVELKSRIPELADQRVSGVLDTDARLSVNLVPGRVILVATGAVPTGIDRLAIDELSVLGALSSDLVGFTAPSLGAGGSLGGGLIGAFPLGQFALGLGATYSVPFEYRPVRQEPLLRAGQEFRLRAGLEGRVARRTYVRVAGVYARRQKDEVGQETQNGVGNRVIGYVAVNQGFGGFAVTAYAFDVLRADPQIETTAAGAAFLPRGNLLAVGARGSVPLTTAIELTPRFEFRQSKQAPDTTTSGSLLWFNDDDLRLLGESMRFGLDVRARVSRHFAVVASGSGLRGFLWRAGKTRFDGYRGGLHLELIP